MAPEQAGGIRDVAFRVRANEEAVQLLTLTRQEGRRTSTRFGGRVDVAQLQPQSGQRTIVCLSASSNSDAATVGRTLEAFLADSRQGMSANGMSAWLALRRTRPSVAAALASRTHGGNHFPHFPLSHLGLGLRKIEDNTIQPSTIT